MAQAGTNNAMAVVGWDDAGPNLSAAQSFTVVNSPSDYLVQASTNLVDWETVFSTIPSALPFQWADPAAVSFGVRFYRIRLGP